MRNNLIINNTGEGIFAMSKFHPRRGSKGAVLPHFELINNTILFSWKHDAIASYGGNAVKVDTDVTLMARGNVFGFGDYGGVDNIKKSKGMTLVGNLFVGNRLYDYREFNTTMRVDAIEDDAELLSDKTAHNVSSKTAQIHVGKRYATLYARRVPISRAAVDAAAKASNSHANAWRGILGLNLRGSTVKTDANIWLPKLAIGEAVAAGHAKIGGRFGCKKP